MCAHCDLQSLIESVGVLCAECGEIVELGDHRLGHDHRAYCEDCFDRWFFECDRCGGVGVHEDSIEINTCYGEGYYCERCADSHGFQCSNCDDWYTNDYSNTTELGDQICDHCRDNSYFFCNSCDQLMPESDYGEDGLCEDCYASNRVIRNYTDRRASNMRKLGHPSNNIYFGVELEVESSCAGEREEDAQSCLELLGEDFAVAKSDSSLGPGGFELVTCPASIGVHRERWTRLLGDAPNGLRSWDTDGRCGMHVHVSREPLSKLHIGKILVFVNQRINIWFTQKVAGRSTHFAVISHKKLSDGMNRSSNRYEAINLQNSDTIEFRIFRGTLNQDSFFKNLEYVAAVIEFTRNAGFRELTVIRFTHWVCERRKDYPALADWLARKGLVPERKRQPVTQQMEQIACA